jgi:hypothetical protein
MVNSSFKSYVELCSEKIKKVKKMNFKLLEELSIHIFPDNKDKIKKIFSEIKSVSELKDKLSGQFELSSQIRDIILNIDKINDYFVLLEKIDKIDVTYIKENPKHLSESLKIQEKELSLRLELSDLHLPIKDINGKNISFTPNIIQDILLSIKHNSLENGVLSKLKMFLNNTFIGLGNLSNNISTSLILLNNNDVHLNKSGKIELEDKESVKEKIENIKLTNVYYKSLNPDEQNSVLKNFFNMPNYMNKSDENELMKYALDIESRKKGKDMFSEKTYAISSLFIKMLLKTGQDTIKIEDQEILGIKIKDIEDIVLKIVESNISNFLEIDDKNDLFNTIKELFLNKIIDKIKESIEYTSEQINEEFISVKSSLEKSLNIKNENFKELSSLLGNNKKASWSRTVQIIGSQLRKLHSEDYIHKGLNTDNYEETFERKDSQNLANIFETEVFNLMIIDLLTDESIRKEKKDILIDSSTGRKIDDIKSKKKYSKDPHEDFELKKGIIQNLNIFYDKSEDLKDDFELEKSNQLLEQLGDDKIKSIRLVLRTIKYYLELEELYKENENFEYNQNTNFNRYNAEYEKKILIKIKELKEKYKIGFIPKKDTYVSIYLDKVKDRENLLKYYVSSSFSKKNEGDFLDFLNQTLDSIKNEKDNNKKNILINSIIDRIPTNKNLSDLGLNEEDLILINKKISKVKLNFEDIKKETFSESKTNLEEPENGYMNGVTNITDNLSHINKTKTSFLIDKMSLFLNDKKDFFNEHKKEVLDISKITNKETWDKYKETENQDIQMNDEDLLEGLIKNPYIFNFLEDNELKMLMIKLKPNKNDVIKSKEYNVLLEFSFATKQLFDGKTDVLKEKYNKYIDIKNDLISFQNEVSILIYDFEIKRKNDILERNEEEFTKRKKNKPTKNNDFKF